MISRSFLASSLVAALAACGGGTVTPAAPTPAPTNTSIATAQALRAGDALDLVLPCTGRVYFGPYEFTAEDQRLAFTTRVHSRSGVQMCGAGAFVDGGDVAQGPAGMGCIQDDDAGDAHLEYVYAPAAGNSDANPIYLSMWTSDGTGAEVTSSTCDQIAVHVTADETP